MVTICTGKGRVFSVKCDWEGTLKIVLALSLLLIPGLNNMFAQQNILGGFLNCRPLPPVDPSKDFLANFNNNCYATPINTSKGGSGLAGDLNAVYGLMFYKVTPGYELVIAGTYPNARFF